jgi:hypothetical protein
MLTREEADKLYTSLVGLSLNPTEISERINIFTEKPKREIKVGDIYLNKNNVPVYIYKEADKIIFNGILLKPQNYIESVNFGIHGEGCNTYDLDLSKKYKLVEIEE